MTDIATVHRRCSRADTSLSSRIVCSLNRLQVQAASLSAHSISSKYKQHQVSADSAQQPQHGRTQRLFSVLYNACSRTTIHLPGSNHGLFSLASFLAYKASLRRTFLRFLGKKTLEVSKGSIQPPGTNFWAPKVKPLTAKGSAR